MNPAKIHILIEPTAPGVVGMKNLPRKIMALLEMTKPTQLLLLSITMFGAYFTAGGGVDVERLVLLALTALGSAGGVTALNMYLEEDIDRAMPRTRTRPLPRGSLSRGEALFGIVLLIVIGTISSSLINRWVLLTTLIGLYFDIIAYTELFKRHTAWAMLAGSVAGSMPALGGWAAGKGYIDLPGIFMAGMVYVWQPLHVSFIHYAYEEDYERAGIPTLHRAIGETWYGLLSLFSILSLLIISWLFVFIEGYGYLTMAIATIVGIMAIRAARGFLRSPNRENARRMIKLASPVLGIIFIFLPIEKIILNTIIR